MEDSMTLLFSAENCISSEIKEETSPPNAHAISPNDADHHSGMVQPTAHRDPEVYASCIRLLNRQLRQPASVEADPICKSNPLRDDFMQSCHGYPDLIALQNTILQLQHGIYLAQQETSTALEDSAAAVHASTCWKREYMHMKQTVAALQKENERLYQDNEKLATDKRILKAAYKNLRAQQHALQTQQVESYVISALSSHEQCLQGSSKNRSRTTTIDTEGTSTDYECCQFGAASLTEDDALSRTGSTTSCVTPTEPPVMGGPSQEEEKIRESYPAFRGFGGAWVGGLKKFKFPKKPTDPTELVSAVQSADSTTDRSWTPTMEPYAPVRLDCCTPTDRSEKSSLIDVLLLEEECSSDLEVVTPVAVGDARVWEAVDPSSVDACSLSLPMLPDPPPSRMRERTGPQIQCIQKKYTCDPLMLRSLSIPVVPLNET
jgi:hypothetical protein